METGDGAAWKILQGPAAIACVCWFEKKDQNKRILPNAVGKYLSAFIEECLEDQNKCVISLCLEKNGF